MALEKVGLQMVLAGSEQYLRKVDQVLKANKLINESTFKTAQATKEASRGTSRATSILAKFGGVAKVAAVGVAAAAAAVAGLTAAVTALAFRGANLRGLATAFDNITASVGILSTTLLADLQEAGRGTIRQFDLMRLSNLALAGATGETGKAIGEALPKLLEVARVQAAATGQSVNFLFDSLVTGVKRSSPRLIDNTGIVLKLGEANERYAEALGVSVEALSEQDQQIALLNATLEAGQGAIDAAGESQETAAIKIARATATISDIFDNLALTVQPAFEAILDGINNVLSGIFGFVNQAAPFLTAIATMVGDLITGLNLNLGTGNDNLARNLFLGAARAFGAFATGIARAANEFIFPAIIGITEFIRDFLIGLSPPKRGPLSDIDKGGGNTMLAWLDGFTSVSLDPVKDVAAQVAAELGTIGSLSARGVANRLAFLDTALQPFEQRLKIVKSVFEEIQAPAEAALAAIERQQATALEALGRGDAGAAATVRALDARREAIQGFVASQQESVDLAQTQLFLARAQQARERALLTIRQGQLPPGGRKGRGKKDDKPRKGKKPKKGGAAEALPVAAGGIEGGIPPGAAGVLEAFGVAGDQVRQAQLDLNSAFLEGADPRVLATFNANKRRLGRATDIIGAVNIGDKLKDKFKPLTDLFDPDEDGSPANLIKKGVDAVFGTSNPLSIPNVIASVDLAGPIALITGQLDILAAAFNLDGVTENLGGLFDPANPLSIPHLLNNIDLSGAETAIEDALNTIVFLFDPLNADGPIGKVVSWLDTIFTGVEIVIDLSGSEETIEDALNGIVSLFDPHNPDSALSAISGFIDGLINPATKGSIPDKLGSIGGKIFSQFNRVRTSIRAFITFLFDPKREQSPFFPITSFIDGLINGDVDGSIPDKLGALGGAIFATFGRVKESILAWVTFLFDPKREDSPFFPVTSFIADLIDQDKEGSIAWQFSQLGDNVATAIGDFGSIITDNVVTPIKDFFTGEGEGTLAGILNAAPQFFANFVTGALDALRGFGLTAFNLVARPLEAVINGVIQIAEQGIKEVYNIIIGALEPQVGTILDVGGKLGEAVQSLKTARDGISLGRVEIATPEILLAPAGSQSTGNTTNVQNNNFQFTGGEPANVNQRVAMITV